MRIRKKAWVEPELNACSFFVKQPSENIGKWHEVFKKKQPIHLELGCGKGSFIAKLASQNENINYIAIDLISQMLGLAKRNIEAEYKAIDREVDNVLIMSHEIEIIQNMMNEKDVVERIYINFCNPWPKPRHNKKRLTHTRQLENYKKFLKDEGEIYFKTDDDNLFRASIKYFEEAGFKIEKITYDLHNEQIWNNNIETEHEKMFTKQGIKIKALIARK
ncbi:MAG: tRNA (guanosine(46)-N7)-methyltransferase TrmB [Clostridiales bacterium]|nr:tRNA (guanosine(46)-N7)-methyltransferase TrmB [Clostridiales bacterium]